VLLPVDGNGYSLDGFAQVWPGLLFFKKPNFIVSTLPLLGKAIDFQFTK